MPTIQQPFEALAHLCASLEIMQSQDYTLRAQVTRIKEVCTKLLRAHPDVAKIMLNQLSALLNLLSNKKALTPTDEALLENLIEMKNDESARKEFHSRLISMEEYGLAGDEDEDTKAQMRIDAFNEAINGTKANMNAPSTPEVTFKMNAGPSFFAPDTTNSPQLTEYPPSIDDTLYKRNEGEGESESIISDKEKAIHLETEQKSFRNEAIYKHVSDNQRPANLTMPDLFFAILHEYKRVNIISSNDPEDQSIKALERIYFKKSIIALLEKKAISYQESTELFTLFNQHNDSFYVKEPEYAAQHEQLNEAILQLFCNKIISFKEAQYLLNLSDNLVSETKNEPPTSPKPRSP